MAGAFQIIREQMPQFLDEPHAREFRDVAGALIPTTPQDVALSALFGPGRAIRSAGAAFLAAQPTDVEAAGPVGAIARLAARSGPAMQDYFWTKGHARRWAREQMDDWAGIGDPEFPDMLRGAGFDSVILRSPTGRIEEAATLYPSNVKSAVESQFGRGNNIRYAKGGLARHIESLGFTPDDAADAVERFEQEREYFPHRGATNYESRPEMYMRHAPDKIIPRKEWPYGPEVGGVHNALEGMVVPSRSLRWLMPEVLAHESQHKIDAGLPEYDVIPQKRQQAEMTVRDRLMEMLSPLRPGDYPHGLTGRDKLGEMAPELVAAEGYLPAGQSLIQSELGKRIFQSPEEKLWYMSRRHPRMRDPEVKGGYLDAITSAAPR